MTQALYAHMDNKIKKKKKKRKRKGSQLVFFPRVDTPYWLCHPGIFPAVRGN
jgi:hypothetical protein